MVTEMTETLSGRIAIHDGGRDWGELTYALAAKDTLVRARRRTGPLGGGAARTWLIPCEQIR